MLKQIRKGIAVLLSAMMISTAVDASILPVTAEGNTEYVSQADEEQVISLQADGIEQPTEKVAEKPTTKPTEKPTQKPTEKPTVLPTVAPTEKPTVKPTEKPTEKPTQASKIQKAPKSSVQSSKATATYTEGNFTYTVDDNNNATITAYADKNATSITIPSTINGYTVTNIGNNVFQNFTALTSVNIPEGVTTIGSYAFYNCTALTNMNIPNSVTTIGQYAFYSCKLTKVEIPDSVINLGGGAFSYCYSLKSVELSSNASILNNSVIFNNCTSLETVIFSKNIKRVGCGVFSNCSNLKDVYYTGTINEWRNIYIDSGTSNGVYNTENKYLRDTASIHFSDVLNDNFYKTANNTDSNYEYIYYKVLEDDTIEITGYAGDVANVVLPDTIEGKTVTKLSDGVFYHNQKIKTVTIPETVTDIGQYTFYECRSLLTINLANNITTIKNFVFYGCTSLKNINIPNSAISIGDYAFYYCSSLTSIDIPNSVTSIGTYAFCRCNNLKIFL